MPRAKKVPTTPIAGPQLVKKPVRKLAAPPAAATVYAQVEQRAYSLFLESGGVHGHDLDHWLAAEREIIAAASSAAARRTMAGRDTRRAG